MPLPGAGAAALRSRPSAAGKAVGAARRGWWVGGGCGAGPGRGSRAAPGAGGGCPRSRERPRRSGRRPRTAAAASTPAWSLSEGRRRADCCAVLGSGAVRAVRLAGQPGGRERAAVSARVRQSVREASRPFCAPLLARCQRRTSCAVPSLSVRWQRCDGL